MMNEFRQLGLYDVEINLFLSHYEGLTTEIRLPDGERLSRRLLPPPISALRDASNPRAYGIQLFDWLFQGETGDAFRRVQWLAQEQGCGIRLRLGLGPRSPLVRERDVNVGAKGIANDADFYPYRKGLREPRAFFELT
jgi:hypothetical protein